MDFSVDSILSGILPTELSDFESVLLNPVAAFD